MGKKKQERKRIARALYELDEAGGGLEAGRVCLSALRSTTDGELSRLRALEKTLSSLMNEIGDVAYRLDVARGYLSRVGTDKT